MNSAYHWTRFFGGIPSRMFLMLAGVSIAFRFEPGSRGGPADAGRGPCGVASRS